MQRYGNYAVAVRLVEAAAVKAIASGSQDRTMSAISHRMSASAPSNSATYLIGAASVSICRPLAITAGARELSYLLLRRAESGSEPKAARSGCRIIMFCAR